MNKILILLLGIVTLSSCSNNDDSSTDQIIGEWKLMMAKIIDFSPNPPIIDYSNENIIYNFKSNGKLVVTGGQNIGYPNGEYEYFFGEDYLGGGLGNEPKVLIVKINGSKWTYNLTGKEMKLGQSYVDGPDLILERK